MTRCICCGRFMRSEHLTKEGQYLKAALDCCSLECFNKFKSKMSLMAYSHQLETMLHNTYYLMVHRHAQSIEMEM